MIRVQQQDFDVGAEIAVLRKGRADIGAIAAFVGLVRDHAGGREVTSMTLEHYPGMTRNSPASKPKPASAGRFSIASSSIAPAGFQRGITSCSL